MSDEPRPGPEPPMSREERDAALARAAAYGIDVSLLARRLALTPAERLRETAQAARSIVRLRAGVIR